MFRVGIVKKDGDIISQNFNTEKEANDFVLDIAEKFGIKHYRILNKETKEIADKGEEI